MNKITKKQEGGRKLGSKIHIILNETTCRRLTIGEYLRLVKLIDKVFNLIP